MGLGKFQSHRGQVLRLIHVIGLTICAVAIVPFTLQLATPASARDGREGHGGNDGGKHFEQPKMVVAPSVQPKPAVAPAMQQPQRQMRENDQKQNTGQPKQVEDRGRRDGGSGGHDSQKQQYSGSQSGSQGSGSQGGGATKSDERQSTATSQGKQTETSQKASSGSDEQSDRAGRSNTGWTKAESSNSSGQTSSGSSSSQTTDSDRSDRGGDLSKTDRNEREGQSGKDNSTPKTQRGDNASGKGSGDDTKSQETKTNERSNSGEDITQTAQPTQHQEDRSFGASTSLLDFFRRNTNASPSAAAAAPAALAATPSAAAQRNSDKDRSDGKQPDKSDVKPTKAAAAQSDKTTDKSKPTDKAVETVRRMPPVEIPFADQTTFKPHEIVASNFSAAQLQKAKSLGFAVPAQTLIGNLGLPSVQRLVVPAGMSEVNAYALLKQEVPSATFSANHVYRILPAAEASERPASADAAAVAPGANFAPCTGEKCFGPALIGWTPEHRTCARRVRIGIIDTSFDLAHPAFAGHKFSNGNFLGDGTTSARDWHGTAVLGLLAGDSRGGTPGLVPDADFYLASAFRTDAEGNASADTIGVLNALSWLEALDVKLINMSFSGPHDELIEKAISVMSANGVIFVAAAGNRGPHAPPSYPAAYSDVIAVTAVGKSLQGYRHANSGDYVDAAAPGVEVWTALPNSKEGFRTGTSFAAPFFTGIVATLPAVQSGRMHKADVLNQLAFKDLGSPGRDPVYGQGLAKVPEHCSNPALIARGQSGPQQSSQPKMSVGAPAATPAATMSPAFAPAPAAAPKRGTAEAASGPSPVR